jgi:hypothetical protein
MTRVTLDPELRRRLHDLQGPVELCDEGGRLVAHVLPTANPDDTSEAGRAEWSDAKNLRRCELVDKEIDGVLTEQEARELAELQDEMLAYRRQVAPLPLEDLRALHQKLLQSTSHREQ